MANLDPRTLGPVLKEIISQPRRAAFGNAVSSLSNRLFSNQGEGGENQEEAPLDLSQLNPNEALQLINTQLNAQNRKDTQQEKKRQFDEKQEVKKEEQDLKYNNSVKPFLREQAKSYQEQKEIKKLAESALKIIKENRNDWPGAIMGNLPTSVQSLIQRNPKIRKYMADIDNLVLLKANSRKGVPSNFKIKMEQLGKAGTDKPVDTQIEILEDIIRQADEVEQDQRYIHSTKDKESGRYPLDIAQNLVEFNMARESPLEFPGAYEEGTEYTDDDGTVYVLKDGKWKKE